MEINVWDYFITQGPFAVLFVWLLYTHQKKSDERETRMNEDSKEREAKLYQTIDDQNVVLRTFSEKYDIVIDKLDEIESRLPN